MTALGDASNRGAAAAAMSKAPASSKAARIETKRPDGKVGTEGQSLQDAFTRFRRDRARERSARAPPWQLRESAARRRAVDPAADKSRLRAKFVEQASKYVGVPYAERYHKPGDALHGKPLYLDCCALVRRAVLDLRDDFGFDIGKWNQAYQFATLPIVTKFEDLRPGDLMFVEGVYHTGRHRQQKMNIVHVEIFLGDEFGTSPRSTLGSRNRWGCVEVHDSCDYASGFYDITAVHWRSLDPWLEGRCDADLLQDCYKSHDPYGDASVRLGIKSIFASEDEAVDADDLDAEDEVGAAHAAVGQPPDVAAATPPDDVVAATPPDDVAAAPPPDVAASTVAATAFLEKRCGLLRLLSDEGAAAGVSRHLDFIGVAALHALSKAVTSALESAGVAPELWREVCLTTSVHCGLYAPPRPAEGAGAMGWKRAFFAQVWPARRKWATESKQDPDEFKIEVCVRFRKAEGSQAASDVALPLHQFLKVQRQRQVEAGGALRVGAFRTPPPEFLDAVTGKRMSDPVVCPNSQAVVDKAWALDHAKRFTTDPFDGSALCYGFDFAQLDDLRFAIEKWVAEDNNETPSGGRAPKVCGSEVVRRLCGEDSALTPEVLEAVLEAERLNAAAKSAHEAALRSDALNAMPRPETPEEAESGAVTEEAATVVATAAILTADLEKSEREVRDLEQAQPSEEEAPLKPCSEAKILAVQPNRVVMHVAGAGVRPFPFSRVFDGEKDQRHVYEACAGPCVSAVLNGLNACVLAYGQTGSGKTHTTFGPPRALELPGGGLGSDAKPEADGVGGVVPRCVAELLRARVEGVEIKVAMQYVEIYNDQCFDLLTGEVCFVRRDDGSLRGAVEAPLNTYDDAVRLLRVGDVRRRFAATAMNSRSSRSHAVVVLSVRQAQLHSGLVLESTLHLVDLAGSERLKKSMATGLRKQEATGINSSLLVLGKVVAALVEGKKHVPYLESTLTTLLRAALGGASRTTALVCCRRDDGHADETLQALRFGKRCALVSNSAEGATAASTVDALKAIDDAISTCKASIASLDGRGKQRLDAYKTLKVRLAQMTHRRRAIADCARAAPPDHAAPNLDHAADARRLAPTLPPTPKKSPPGEEDDDALRHVPPAAP